MTQISRNDVQHLAQLSSLGLSEAEIDDLQADLGTILSYVKQLDDLDTTGVEPTYQVTGLSNIWRDDSVVPIVVPREQLLNLAADHTDNSIKVPKVLS